ncbi:CopL family metal-binding regulatory protein [Lysobacter hankyongensis]|jgi:hypothetical protein|uniref:CopL family metal-binding regulatory protein n=1 Tax=Lysobacter hankyongensis TaxID=1176535 RepID=UPI003CD07281
MPTLPALLRIFLILVLVLNGIGNAYASAMMVTGAKQSSVEARSADASGDRALTSSCPDHHDAMAMEPGMIEREKPASPPSSGDRHGSPDCCDPSHCKCPCMHACAALPVLAVRMRVPLGNDVGVRRLSLGHPAPVLPHLIRPPIG